MNYISNPMEMCCCSLDENNDIFVRPTEVLIELETGKALTFAERPTVGYAYECVKKYALMKSYATVKLYSTEVEAKAAYDELVKELGEQGKVFKV